MRAIRLSGCAVLALVLAAGISAFADDAKSNHSTDGPYAACAKTCGECAMMCDICSAYCAQVLANGHKDHLPALQSCRDCATVCAAAAGITARTGPYSTDICRACADVCKKCGEVCAAMSSDATMKRCADECRRCEKTCRDMLTMGHNR